MQNLSPVTPRAKRVAAAIVGSAALLTLVADLAVPEDLDLSVFYALSIAACAWLTSRRLLWLATASFLVLVFADLYLGSPPVHPDDPWWLHIANRCFVASALVVLATIVHLWMRSQQMLEESRVAVERRVGERTRELEIVSQRQHEAETALHHAQKLEAVGQLTGGVAHDFNNLLTVIAGNADMLRRSMTKGRDERRVEAILQAAELGEKLTRHLLAFSRRQALQPEVLDLRKRTRDLRDLLARSLREDIRVALALADDLWTIEADPRELELALLNVAVNARDAMPGGGVLRIEGRNANFAAGEDGENGLVGDFVALSLADTGTGIAPALLHRIFEPFFTTKESGKGSGLGLSQVYGFTRQSGGAVSVASELGRGTTITLYLPRAHEPAAARPAAAVAKAELTGSGDILLVEDNPHVAETMAEMLEQLGYTVHRVDDAQTALTILEEQRSFELVVSDIVMPGGMNGADLAQAIRQRFPALPVVLTTGYSQAAAEVGQKGFMILRKPYRAEDLAEAVGGCIACNRERATWSPRCGSCMWARAAAAALRTTEEGAPRPFDA